MTEVNGRFVPTKEVRMVFPNLYEAKAVVKNGKARGEPKFSARFLIKIEDKTIIDAIKAKAVEVARAKWPGVDLKTLKFPFADGNAEAEKSKAKGKDGSVFKGTFVIGS